MAAALLVRTGPASFQGTTDEAREAYTDENGVPYLTDMDSYYHVRLVDQFLENGRLGDIVLEDGTEWDMHSFAPTGRSAEYEPGIVWLTVGTWRVFGGSLDMLEYRLAAFVSTLAALAAFLIGWRIGGVFGGLTAGLLVGCAPQFVLRTCFGRFDTDMFVVLMECVLILLLTEALRAEKLWHRIAFGAGFALTSVLYGLCWMPRYSALFAGLTLIGGIGAVLGMTKSAVSHQLRALRGEGLVRARRAGKNIFYALDDQHVTQILETTIEHVRHKVGHGE